MMYNLSEDQLRSHAKNRLESLEFWLRRLIDQELRSKFGDYFEYADDLGNYIINSGIRRNLIDRQKKEPGRYARPVDAILFEDAVAIVCNPNLYSYFSPALHNAFPEGQAEARTFLTRLLDPRNKLAHGNAISLRQAEQVACYTGDIMDSIKLYYLTMGKQNEFNVPVIIKFTDSFGHAIFREAMGGANAGGVSLSFARNPDAVLRPGDTLTLEVEVDPSYADDSFSVTWTSVGTGNLQQGKRAIYQIDERYVSTSFEFHCKVHSDKNWHRLPGGMDDLLVVYYKILPPISDF